MKDGNELWCDACCKICDKLETDHKIPRAFYLEPTSVGRNFCEKERYGDISLLEFCRSAENSWDLCLRCHADKTKWDNRVLAHLNDGNMSFENAVKAFRNNVCAIMRKEV